MTFANIYEKCLFLMKNAYSRIDFMKSIWISELLVLHLAKLILKIIRIFALCNKKSQMTSKFKFFIGVDAYKDSQKVLSDFFPLWIFCLVLTPNL